MPRTRAAAGVGGTQKWKALSEVGGETRTEKRQRAVRQPVSRGQNKAGVTTD